MKRPFMSGYRTYDTGEGYGGPRQWRAAFARRMGREEAEEVLRGARRTPYEVLGILPGARWAEIKSAYRRAAMACHPDRCHVHSLSPAAATERFKAVTAAYTLLELQHG